MSKLLTAGSEVDAYCTKCRMDLNHRIVAMVGPAVKRVECLTCGGQHNYRRPESADASPARRARMSAVGGKRAPARAKVDNVRKAWEDAIMGRSPDDFVAYTIAQVFAEGQLMRHKKFGDGVVSAVVEGGKIHVIFEDGEKTLVHAR